MKKNLLFFTCFAFLGYNFCEGQNSFEKSFGGIGVGRYDQGYKVINTIDDGYAISGISQNTVDDSSDIYLIKTDSSGGLLWTKRIGGIRNEAGHDIKQTSDSGFIVTGYTYSYGAGMCDLFLLKTDINGDTLWVKTYGGSDNDYGMSVCENFDGGYTVVGSTESAGMYSKVYVINTDANGDTLWTRAYGGTNIDDGGGSILQTSDSGYIISGSTDNGASDISLIKISASGNLLWSKNIGGSSYDNSTDLKQTSDGGYIVVGSTWSFSPQHDIYLFKTTSNGSLIWSKTFGGIYDDYGFSVEQTPDDGYIVSGKLGYTYLPGCLIKTNVIGDTLWTKIYGGVYGSQIYCVTQTNTGDFVASGSHGSSSRAYLIRTNALGNTGCADVPSSLTVSNPASQQGNPNLTMMQTNTVVGSASFQVNTLNNEFVLCVPVEASEYFHSKINLSAYFSRSHALSLTFSTLEPSNLNLTVLDFSGRTLYQTQLAANNGVNKKEVQVGDFAKGIYIVTLSGVEGSESVKVVKE